MRVIVVYENTPNRPFIYGVLTKEQFKNEKNVRDLFSVFEGYNYDNLFKHGVSINSQNENFSIHAEEMEMEM